MSYWLPQEENPVYDHVQFDVVLDINKSNYFELATKFKGG